MTIQTNATATQPIMSTVSETASASKQNQPALVNNIQSLGSPVGNASVTISAAGRTLADLLADPRTVMSKREIPEGMEAGPTTETQEEWEARRKAQELARQEATAKLNLAIQMQVDLQREIHDHKDSRVNAGILNQLRDQVADLARQIPRSNTEAWEMLQFAKDFVAQDRMAIHHQDARQIGHLLSHLLGDAIVASQTASGDHDLARQNQRGVEQGREQAQALMARIREESANRSQPRFATVEQVLKLSFAELLSMAQD